MKPMLALVISLLSIQNIAAQERKTPLSNEYQFKDGIYMSFEEFKGDSPKYPASRMRIVRIDSSDYHLKNIRKIKVSDDKGKFRSISLRKIWGLCYMGQPYVNYRGGIASAGSKNSSSTFNSIFKGSSVTFALLDIIGKICVFTLEGQENNYNTNTMVNPSFPRDPVYIQNMMIDMNTGQILHCDYNTVKEQIKEDADLVHEMQIHSHTLNLFDIIISYNRRYPLFPDPVSVSYPPNDPNNNDQSENLELEIIENF